MTSERPSTRTRRALGYMLITLSIGLIPAWPDLMGHTAALGTAADAAGVLLDNAHQSLLVGMIAGGLLLAFLPHIVTRHLKATALTSGAVGAVATLVFTLGSQPAGAIAVSVTGIALILLYGVTFYPLSASASMSSIGWVCTAALVIKGLSLHVLDCAPPTLAMILIVCMPLISGAGACWYTCICGHTGQQPSGKNEQVARMGFGKVTHASVTILIVVSCVAYALMRCGSNMVLWGSRNPVASLSPVALGCLALSFVIACYATFVRAPGDLMLRFIPSVLVQTVAFGVIWCGLAPQLGLTEELGVPLLSELSELYGHMYMFMVMFLVLSVLGKEGVRIHGVQWALSAGCVALALALGLDRANTTQFVLLACTNVAMVVAFAATHVAFGHDQLAAIATITHLKETRRPGEKRESHSDIFEEMTDMLDALSARYLLSDREREVLVLIVQGGTRDSIGDQIHLAPGTVSTYIARIYRKFRVHTRQELMGLVYQELSALERS